MSMISSTSITSISGVVFISTITSASRSSEPLIWMSEFSAARLLLAANTVASRTSRTPTSMQTRPTMRIVRSSSAANCSSAWRNRCGDRNGRTPSSTSNSPRAPSRSVSTPPISSPMLPPAAQTKP